MLSLKDLATLNGENFEFARQQICEIKGKLRSHEHL